MDLKKFCFEVKTIGSSFKIVGGFAFAIPKQQKCLSDTLFVQNKW